MGTEKNNQIVAREDNPLINQAKELLVEAPATFLNMLPSSLEDESYIIFSMFYFQDKAEKIINQVDRDDFLDPLNQKVFDICEVLADSGEIITSYSLRAEFSRRFIGAWENWDVPSVWQLETRYNREAFIKIPDGLKGAIRRVKQDRAYREIIYRANDALLLARAREGDPLQIIAPLETLTHEILKTSSSVIVWADEAERQAQETYDKMDKGEFVAYPLGFPEIDKKLYGGGTWGGDLVLVSGVTSGGKTTFALNCSANDGELGLPNLYFTMEMKTFKVFSRQHSSRARIPGYLIRPKMSEIYPELNIREKLYNTGADMAKLPIGYIDSLRDMESIRRVTKFAVREKGVKRVYIDYLGLTAPSKRFKGSRFEAQSIVAEQAKEMAQELDVTVVALTQLRRKDKSEKSKNDIEGNLVEPTLDMLKNSGELENSADTVIFLWGEKGLEGEKDAIRHIYGKVAKQRNGELFKFELKFAPSIFTFTSIEKLMQLRQQMEEAEF